MTEIKLKLEKKFENFGRVVYRNWIIFLIGVIIFVTLLGIRIPKLTVDTSWEGMLRKNDPGRIAYNEFRDQFGQDRIIVVAVKSSEIFSEKFLIELQHLHERLETEVPYVEEIHSLVNERSTRGEGDVLLVDELLEGWPEKKIDLKKLKKYVLSNPYFLNHIVSEDGSVTALVIETEATLKGKDKEDDLLDGFEEETDQQEDTEIEKAYFSEKELSEVVDAVNRIVENYRKKGFEIAVTGGPFIEDAFNRLTKDDLFFLISLTSGACIFFLAFLFRRISGIILPYMVIIAADVSVLGLIDLFNKPLTIMTTIVPSFVMAVGIADSVHVLAIFFRKYQEGGTKEDAIAYALGHSGLAIVMTSLTTAAGLMSFAFAELEAIGDMGLFTAAGVVMALLFTIVMLPALIAIIPIKQKTRSKEKNESLMDRILLWFADFSTSHPWEIIAVSIVICIMSVIGLFKIDFSHDMMKFFPDNLRLKPDLYFIDREMNGIIALEAVVDTKKENGIYDTEILNRIDNISKDVMNIKMTDIYIGKIFSINDILRETNQALHGNNPEFYTIPQDHDTIAQELLLFENSGSDDLERLVDSQFSMTRITMKIRWVEIFKAEKFITEVKRRFNDMFAGKADIQITGMAGLMGNTVPAALRSMAQSYLIAGIVITIMMIMLVGDLKLGLISMVPNLMPIIMVMGFMAYIKVPLDFNGLMIGSIAIGLVVDDTMHFMYNFRKYYTATGNTHVAVQETLLGTGRALLITSLVLSASFFITMLATLTNSVIFGFFTGIVILLALMADFVLAPALMVIFTRKKQDKGLMLKGQKQG